VALALFLSFLVPWGVLLGWIREVSVAGWPVAVVYSALYMPLVALLVRGVSRQWLFSRVPLAVTAAVVWTALEYVRAEVVFDAWPFYLAAHGVYPTWLIQYASVGGVWLVSFLVVLLSVGLWGILLGCAQRRATIVWMLLCLCLPWMPIVLGYLLNGPYQVRPGPALRMLCVQTNLPQSNKIGWSQQQQAQDVQGFIAQTLEGLAAIDPQDGPVDLVVWPETMVPGLGFDHGTREVLERLGPSASHLARWPQAIEAAAARTGIPWLVGSPTWLDLTLDEDGFLQSETRFNSAVLVAPDGGLQRYDKVFLTPFGETMPWIRAWPWLESLLMDLGASGLHFDLQQGDAPVALSIETETQWNKWTTRLVTPICFEDAVPSVVRRLVLETDADIIVTLCNDGWFGRDDAGRRAHEIAAAFRTIELERPLVRVANTGFTSLINQYGRIVSRLDAQIQGTLLVQAHSSRWWSPTTYARFGNWFPWTMLGLTLVGVILRIVRGPSKPMEGAA
jgi:apolipoprotein N-acyltransferase